MLYRALLASLITLSTSLACFAADEDYMAGRQLFMGGTCTECHWHHNSFDFKKHEAIDFIKLHGWVTACNTNYDQGWNRSEIAQVVDWLNRTYYHHPVQPLPFTPTEEDEDF